MLKKMTPNFASGKDIGNIYENTNMKHSIPPPMPFVRE